MNIIERPDPERLHVLAAQLRLWLLDVCVWLSEWLGVKLPREMRIELRADIRRGVMGARVVIFMLAMSRCGAPPIGVHSNHPPSAPRGFRLTNALDNDLRSMCRAVRLRGRTIGEKLVALRDVLDTLDAWVARVHRRLMALPHGVRLVLCVALADRLRALATPAASFVDSS